MNKEDLQQNNTGLQSILATIKSLPSAKAWGGGAPIIEPSIEDIVIPAFTNVDLTIKGVDLLKFGVSKGTFYATQAMKDARETTFYHNLNAKPRFIYAVGTGYAPYGDDIFLVDAEKNVGYNGNRQIQNLSSSSSSVTTTTFTLYTSDIALMNYYWYAIL